MASIRSYDMKVVERDQAMNYTGFGWVRSKEAIPADMAVKSKKPTLLMKRREEYGMNPVISSNEAEYDKLYKQNTKNKGAKNAFAAIFGIITFILMIALIAVAAFELYFGITIGLADKKAADEAAAKEEEVAEDAAEEVAEEEETKEDSKIVTMLKDIHRDYVSMVTVFIDGSYAEDKIVTDDGEEKTVVKTEESGKFVLKTEDEEGYKAPLLALSIDGPVGYFINTDTIVGVVALVLGIVFIIIFASIAKMGKRRKARAAKMLTIAETIKAEVTRMRKTDVSLMTKAQRKQYMWESIITNALINARAPIAEKEDDDDDDDF